MKRESLQIEKKANLLDPDTEGRKKEDLMKQSREIEEEAKKFEKEEEEKVKANFRPLACEVRPKSLELFQMCCDSAFPDQLCGLQGLWDGLCQPVAKNLTCLTQARGPRGNNEGEYEDHLRYKATSPNEWQSDPFLH